MQVNEKLKNNFLDLIYLNWCYARLDPDQDPPHSAKNLNENSKRRGHGFSVFFRSWRTSLLLHPNLSLIVTRIARIVGCFLNEGVTSSRRSLQPSKDNFQSHKYEISLFFLFFCWPALSFYMQIRITDPHAVSQLI